MVQVIYISFWLFMQSAHVSMISINQVQDTDSLKVSCRMKFDDFLKDLQTIDDDRNLRKVFSNPPFPTDLINMYFNSKVFISINKKLLIGKLLTADLSEDDIILNLLYKSEKKPKSITVRNLILTGWYSDQTNLLIIKINHLEEGIRLTPEHSEETFLIK